MSLIRPEVIAGPIPRKPRPENVSLLKSESGSDFFGLAFLLAVLALAAVDLSTAASFEEPALFAAAAESPNWGASRPKSNNAAPADLIVPPRF
jgi:hypothetical protein